MRKKILRWIQEILVACWYNSKGEVYLVPDSWRTAALNMMEKRINEAEEILEFYSDPKNFIIHSRMIGGGTPGNMRKTSEEIRITWPWMEARSYFDKHKKG